MMQAELKMSGITNVGMHNLSPGMVTTDLLMSGNDQFVPTTRDSSLPAAYMLQSLWLTF